MTVRSILILAAALAACAPAVVAADPQAREATVTASVNVRSAPDRSVPTVTWLLTGTRVTVIGCDTGWRWCDVVAGRDRGWVYSRYLSLPSRGSAVTVAAAGADLGLPVLDFELGPYWNEHYASRMFFPEKASWQARWDRRRDAAEARGTPARR
jgi:uncharacterized protein YraI